MPSNSQSKTTIFLATTCLWVLSILFEQNPPAWCCLPQLRPVLQSTEWVEQEVRSRTTHQGGGWSQSQEAQRLPHLIPRRQQKPVTSQFHEGAVRMHLWPSVDDGDGGDDDYDDKDHHTPVEGRAAQAWLHLFWGNWGSSFARPVKLYLQAISSFSWKICFFYIVGEYINFMVNNHTSIRKVIGCLKCLVFRIRNTNKLQDFPGNFHSFILHSFAA